MSAVGAKADIRLYLRHLGARLWYKTTPRESLSKQRAAERQPNAPASMAWNRHVPNALTRRLEAYTPLTEADRQELARLCAQSTHTIQAKRDLIREGDAPSSVFVIIEGWGYQYRRLDDGRRQIVDFA